MWIHNLILSVWNAVFFAVRSYPSLCFSSRRCSSHQKAVVFFHPRSGEARFCHTASPGGSKRVEGKSRVKTINPGADVFCCFVGEISAAFFCCFLLGLLLLYKVSFLKGGSSNTQLNGSPPFCGGGGWGAFIFVFSQKNMWQRVFTPSAARLKNCWSEVIRSYLTFKVVANSVEGLELFFFSEERSCFAQFIGWSAWGEWCKRKQGEPWFAHPFCWGHGMGCGKRG